jgi:outer membrane protein assembly factor BamB
MVKALIALLCLLSLFSLSVVPFANADWSMFRSDPSHSGVATETSIGNSAFSPTLLWRTHIGFPADAKASIRFWSSCAVVNNVVYIGSISTVNTSPYDSYSWGSLLALNAANGLTIWNYNDKSSSSMDSSPAVVSGAVFFGVSTGLNGYVAALDTSSGTLLWNYTVGGLVSSSPTVVNDIVYVGTYNGLDGGIYALNATNGDKIWYFPTYGGVMWSSPAVVNGILYVGSRVDNNIYALKATNGEQIWNFTTGDSVISSPAVIDGTVYICAKQNVYALNAINGAKIWNYSTKGSDWSSPAVAYGLVYVCSSTSVYALDAVNGVRVWNYSTDYNGGGSSPAISNGVVYVHLNDNNLYALNAFNGKKIWTYPLRFNSQPFPPSPSVSDGILYIGSGDDEVIALSGLPVIELQDSPPDSSATPSVPEFPMFNLALLLLSIFLVAIIFMVKKKATCQQGNF